jgi:hypothetical protein
VDTSIHFRREEQNTHERSYRDQVWSRDWRNDHLETDSPGDPSHLQSSNAGTDVDANKFFLTGVWYSCLLRGSVSAWQIQKRMLTAIHWTEHRNPNEGAGESTQGAEGVFIPIGGTTWTSQYPQSSQGLNNQPKSIHGGTHGSSCRCSRGWSSRTSMGEDALCPMKALCLSVGE